MPPKGAATLCHIDTRYRSPEGGATYCHILDVVGPRIMDIPPVVPRRGATICHIDMVHGSWVKVIHRFIFVLCETFNVRVRRDFLNVVKIIINKERRIL